MLNESDLHAVMPGARASRIAELLDPINVVLEQYEINTLARRAAFLATVAHETAQLTYLSEIWGPTSSQRRYDPPSSLAARLGNTKVGDGKRFRGRGLLMLTGRDNYQRAGDALGYSLVDDPDVVEHDPRWAAATAGWFWRVNGMNKVADSEDIRAVTLVVNGGTNGLADRTWYYERAYEVLPA